MDSLQDSLQDIKSRVLLTVGKSRSSHTPQKATPKYMPFLVYAIVLSAWLKIIPMTSPTLQAK